MRAPRLFDRTGWNDASRGCLACPESHQVEPGAPRLVTPSLARGPFSSLALPSSLQSLWPRSLSVTPLPPGAHNAGYARIAICAGDSHEPPRRRLPASGSTVWLCLSLCLLSANLTPHLTGQFVSIPLIF